MSLDKLRQENREELQKRAKGPTPQHVAELRDALAAVLGTAVPAAPTPAPAPKSQPVPAPKPIPQSPSMPNVEVGPPHGGSTSIVQKPKETPKEVPETVLKKLFEREGK